MLGGIPKLRPTTQEWKITRIVLMPFFTSAPNTSTPLHLHRLDSSVGVAIRSSEAPKPAMPTSCFLHKPGRAVISLVGFQSDNSFESLEMPKLWIFQRTQETTMSASMCGGANIIPSPLTCCRPLHA